MNNNIAMCVLCIQILSCMYYVYKYCLVCIMYTNIALCVLCIQILPCVYYIYKYCLVCIHYLRGGGNG